MSMHHHLRKKAKLFALFLPALFLSAIAMAQSNDIVVKGTVRSDSGSLEGVTVTLKTNPKIATKTNEKGTYFIKVPANGTLVFTSIGFQTTEMDVKGENVINMTMKQNGNSMDEVAVVAFGNQKKTSMVSAVTTIDPKELKGPTSNLTTMLAGRIAGVTGFQRSGEPGADNASFFIRGIATFGGKQDPLILIDNVESAANDLARLQPDDIAAFSILKDAPAAAVYGSRGANGVILVTTKRGKEGKPTFNARYETSVSGNTQNFKFADNISYMNLANEAYLLRKNDDAVPYSPEKIAMTASGADPYKYPSNDWLHQMIKDNTLNQRANVNLSGGNKMATYYISGTYNVDNGLLKTNDINNFNNNIKLKNYEIMSNVTINVTPTTVATVLMYGQFDDYQGPRGGGSTYFSQALGSNPVKFPAFYPQSYGPQYKHILFGNASSNPVQGASHSADYNNPYANMVSGFQQYSTANMKAQFQLSQDLRFLLPGLNFKTSAYTLRYSTAQVLRGYRPYYYTLYYDQINEKDTLMSLNDGTEYLDYYGAPKYVTTTNYFDASLNYAYVFNKVHSVSASLISFFRSALNDNNSQDLQQTLPYRNANYSGRFAYGYDNRYFAEFDFGYNGSERFAQNHRYGFFPSGGISWNVSNEKFFEPLLNTINRFKLRFSYGMLGNDQIGSSSDRFFYLSNVNMNDDNKGAVFGTPGGYTASQGISVSRYENKNITWEQATKTNFGAEIQLLRDFTLTVDLYKEKRENILMSRPTIPSTMGITTDIRANTGKAESHGVDLTVDYNKTFSTYNWILFHGTLTYAANKFTEIEEPKYPQAYRSRVGHSIDQQWGLIAERLFVDEAEIKNSPHQDFGVVQPGDIKYHDINGDGKIEGDGDQVPVGFPTTPEITYGFGFTFGFHHFEFNTLFEGNARTSLFVSNPQVQPFKTNDFGGENGLLKVIADDHWSPNNQNVYAFWPRLSSDVVTNNQWTSTWWLHNGAYMRMKTAEIAYNIPAPFLKRYRLRNVRLYANALNLFVISPFKLWDPEMGSNGLGYPQQRVYNFGINLGL